MASICRGARRTIEAAPGHLDARDFSLGAGALRLDGALDCDVTGPQPVVAGRLDAALLTLPALPGRDAMLPFGLLQHWQGRIAFAAQQVSAGPATLATRAEGAITVADGDALAELSADMAGGHFSGEMAVDATPALPALALQGSLNGAGIDALPALPGLDFSSGTVDIDGDITAAGNSPGALLVTLNGAVHGAVHGAALRNIDLPVLARLLAGRGPRLRAGLTDALASGDSGALSGGFDATLQSGELTIRGATFSGPAGAVTIAGGIDLPGRSPDLLLRAMPAVPHGPGLIVRVVAGRRVPDVQAGLLWAGAGTVKRKK